MNEQKSLLSSSSIIVLRYIYMLISIIIVFSTLIFTIIQQQNDAHAELTLKTHNFYLAGINITIQIQDDIDRARLALLQRTVSFSAETKSPVQNVLDPNAILKNIVIELRDHNQQLQALHRKYDDPDFIPLTKRIDSAIDIEGKEDLVKQDNANLHQVITHFDPIYNTAHQLKSLYSRKLEVLNINAPSSTQTLDQQNIAIILFIGSIAAIFTFLIIRTVKRIGNEQTASSNQLNQFKSTLDSTNDCVFMFTSDTLQFNYFNQGALQQIGYTPDELTSMSPFDIKPEFNEEQFREFIAPFLNGEKDYMFFETIHQHKDGHNIPVEIGLQYFHPDNDSPHFLAIVRDISERKRTENELRRYQFQLERLVDERTDELRSAQDELVRKERLATLGKLTATVSHELRNPLGSLRPSLYIIETISRDNKNEKLQTAIERMNRSIDRCDKIIDELLDYTRITELSLQTVVFDEWLKEVIYDQPLLKGIELVYQPGLENIRLNIDSDRLRRAIINIFENACHAMLVSDSTTEVMENARLTIQTQTSDDRIRIIIRDTGVGIPNEIKERIFEPLFSTKGFGVGLGMPTVQQIMQQHQGGVDIETSNTGTRITLWLPRAG